MHPVTITIIQLSGDIPARFTRYFIAEEKSSTAEAATTEAPGK